MLFYGSVCAMILSAFFYRKPRTSWALLLQRLVYDIKFNLMGIRGIVSDWANAKYNLNVHPLQTGRVAVVTGGSRGIGFEVVKVLLQLDMEVIIACRTPTAGHKAILQIKESGINTERAKVYKLDNSSLESVKQFAEQVKQDYEKIHVLINNAGVMFCPYDETEDGFEHQWAVNHLSHFLLASLLLPLLNAGGLPRRCSRIVNVTSCAHILGKINFNDVNNKENFVTQAAYAQSKLAQQIITKKLQDVLRKKEFNVQVYSVHPGIVLTDLFVHSYISKLRVLFYPLFKTPKQGACPIVYTAVNKAIEESGGAYINNCRVSPVHADSLNPFIQEQLYELSLRQVRLKDFFQHV